MNLDKNMNICQHCNVDTSAGYSCVCRGEKYKITMFNLIQWGNDNGIEIRVETNEDGMYGNTSTTILFIDRTTFNYKTITGYNAESAFEILNYSLEKIFCELKMKPLRNISL